MRRAVQNSTKPSWDLNEIVQPEQSKSATSVSTKKFRKIKSLDSESRIHTPQLCRLKDTESKQESPRTRSDSPPSPGPPAEAKLPFVKFYKIYSKIVSQLELVKNFTNTKKNETENLLDLRRQLQRADEFSIRFSRNNLYETKRIIKDIKQFVFPHPFEKFLPDQCGALLKKIILAFQAASQALQTYINYVQNPCNLEIPEKIHELVLIIADLFLWCEHISLPADNVYIKSDAVKVCNELMVLFKSKIPVYDYVKLKEADVTKKRGKTVTEDVQKMKKFSMYKPKMAPKLKADLPKKKNSNCFLAIKARKSKKNEKQAMITHEIYTQSLNALQGNGLNGNKVVKFKPSEEKIENPEKTEKKQPVRRQKNPTPREVRSQDDDVETVVQTIGDDESVSKITSTPREIDEGKKDFENLLLEAIEELKTSDKTDQKLTLNKLLNSIHNFSKIPNQDRVKVYHFISEDLSKEMQTKETESEIKTTDKQTDEGEEIPEDFSLKERRPTYLFKPLKPNDGIKSGEAVSRGKVKLKLSEEAMTNANKYKKAFAEYRKNNIMYQRTLTNTPWELVGKVSDRIILDLIKEISQDFQSDSMLRGLYLSELLEVTS